MTSAGSKPAVSTTCSGLLLQRSCDCGQHTGGGECEDCSKKNGMLQRKSNASQGPDVAPPIVHDVLRSPGQPLDAETRAFFEPRFAQDFSEVRVHTDERAWESARAVKAEAYTVGQQIVFARGQYSPGSSAGKQLLAHELAHTRQQAGNRGAGTPSEIRVSDDHGAEQGARAAVEAVAGGGPAVAQAGFAPALRRRAAPYIKKVNVHLTPSQSADLQWEGSPPQDAPGSDHFTVSTGKGYSDPGDPAGTCTRDCCSDANTQCAPPWNQPGRVGACCTYFGNNFWTGTPLTDHNGWNWWTPIQPYYSSRGIALHGHPEVTGQPIGHGCVRMADDNAKRIHDFSNGQRTNVTIDGRAAPVLCADDRRCAAAGGGGQRGELGRGRPSEALAQQEAVPGQEGVLS
jgi:hypothetical protein